MSGVPVLALLQGSYLPSVWQRIKQDPESAPAAIERVAAAARCRLARFYFALGEFDVVFFVEGESLAQVSALRHALMASGDFERLHSEPLLTWDAILPVLKAVREATAPL